MDKNVKIIRFVLVILLILSAFYLGLAYGLVSNKVVTDDDIVLGLIDENSNMVNDIEKIIANNFIGEIDRQKLYHGLMSGLVSGLDDPYSEYLNPEESKLFWEDVNGEYEGVGIEITIKDGGANILSVIESSPAMEAGVLPGDMILAVDDMDVEGMTLSEVATKIKGERGTKVKLLLLRNTELVEVDILRDKVEADSVGAEMADGLLLISIYRFDDDTDSELVKKIAGFDLNSIKGIILDVRSNPGGYFDASVTVADQFLDDGLIVSEREKSGETKEYYADQGDSLEQVPLVVLMNGYSASAAEILAGAIRDQGRGELIGEKSYGKGSVQIIEDLSDGSTLKITIAEWLTPNGYNLRQSGLIPDYEVANDDPNIDKQYEKAKEILINKINN